MKKLFLSSSFCEVASLLPTFQNKLIGKTVTFIPTASVAEGDAGYVDCEKKALEDLGLKVDILEVSKASIEEITTKLTKNDIIHITGGNTFFLLQELKRTGADKIIESEVMAGKLYIGESAGSVITAPNIEYIKAMDSVKKAPKLQSFGALNLVDFYTVPHFGSFPFKEAAEKIKETYSKIIPLTFISNNEVLFIEGEKTTKITL